MQEKLKIVIAGANGRMGRMLISAIMENTNINLYGALEHQGSAVLGQDAGLPLGVSTNIMIQDNLDKALEGADILIDFTRPEGSIKHIEYCRKHHVNLVLGTTGFSDEQKQIIEMAAKQIAIVFAANFSIGVNVTFALLDLAARILNKGYDTEIIEAHHRHKVDAPSGTALRMGEVIAQAQGKNLKECAVYAREGYTGERDPQSIGFSTVRAGDIVGDHTVMFATEGERVEITHKASNRMTFASGAVQAALWLYNQQNGLYDMQDVLNLRET